MNEKQANNLEIPGVVTLGKGRGDLPKVDVQTRWSRAEIYLQGAHVTQFQRTEDAPVLFMSSLSPFAPGKAIRGGVPICYPWFGPREGDVAHGFARIVDWHWIQTRVTEDGAELKFVLPEIAAKASWPKSATEYIVTIGDALSLELRTTNLSETNLELEDCLHTYLAVREVKEITVRGLESTEYLDKTDGGKCKREGESPIRVQKETNRVYFDTTQTIEVTDPGNGRVLRVEKSGSRSTVLWNPWTTQKLPDMPGEEHSGMICVESGNVGPNKRTVKPGEIVSLKATISSIKI